MTKHSVGVYSCKEWLPARRRAWAREDPAAAAAAMAALPRMPVAEAPDGRAAIETFTVRRRASHPGSSAACSPRRSARQVMHRGEQASEIVIFGVLAGGPQRGHRFAAQAKHRSARAAAACTALSCLPRDGLHAVRRWRRHRRTCAGRWTRRAASSAAAAASLPTRGARPSCPTPSQPHACETTNSRASTAELSDWENAATDPWCYVGSVASVVLTAVL